MHSFGPIFKEWEDKFGNQWSWNLAAFNGLMCKESGRGWVSNKETPYYKEFTEQRAKLVEWFKYQAKVHAEDEVGSFHLDVNNHLEDWEFYPGAPFDYKTVVAVLNEEYHWNGEELFEQIIDILASDSNTDYDLLIKDKYVRDMWKEIFLKEAYKRFYSILTVAREDEADWW